VIEESGVVLSVQGDMAEVEAQRQSSCGGCAVTATCGTSLLARHLGGRRSLLRAHNTIGAQPGEAVIIGIPEGALLDASFVAYLVPLLTMIAGGIVGAYIGDWAAPAYTQALSILSGVGGLAAALAWLVGFSHAKSADDRYRPRIMRRAGGTGHDQAVRLGICDLTGNEFTRGT